MKNSISIELYFRKWIRQHGVTVLNKDFEYEYCVQRITINARCMCFFSDVHNWVMHIVWTLETLNHLFIQVKRVNKETLQSVPRLMINPLE